MNPRLQDLQPYPFDRLRALLAGVASEGKRPMVDLSIGEPRHPAPLRVGEALTAALDGLSSYPATIGTPALRQTLAQWLSRRHGLPAVDPESQVLPVNGSREALFAFAQAMVDPERRGSGVLMPNPFYQIYEGAALLAGARPVYANTTAETGWKIDFHGVPPESWQGLSLVYVCSPGNPAGAVMDLEDWKTLFDLSDRHGFVVASDECYSEIYLDEDHPPLGGLAAAQRLGRTSFERLVVFGSLSKRSSVPGLRSGYVAGDAQLIKAFGLYRTYHGSAMSLPVQAASIAAWQDEEHVRQNRALYREKFEKVLPILGSVMPVERPAAGFYIWLAVPGDDTVFCRALLEQAQVKSLPGSFLARQHRGVNPGAGRLRLALVAPVDACVEAAHRLAEFVRQNHLN